MVRDTRTNNSPFQLRVLYIFIVMALCSNFYGLWLATRLEGGEEDRFFINRGDDAPSPLADPHVALVVDPNTPLLSLLSSATSSVSSVAIYDDERDRLHRHHSQEYTMNQSSIFELRNRRKQYSPPSVASSSAAMVVQLRGEMANHLSSIAHGVGLQLWAIENFNLSTHMILRHQTMAVPPSPAPQRDQPSLMNMTADLKHRILPSTTTRSRTRTTVQDNPKWVTTSQVLKKCFPAMAEWDFTMGSQWQDFDEKWKILQTEMGVTGGAQPPAPQKPTSSSSFASQVVTHGKQPQQEQKEPRHQTSQLSPNVMLVNGRIMIGREGTDGMKEPITPREVEEGLSAFAHYWQEQHRGQHRHKSNTEPPSLLTMPFLYSDSMDNNVLIDRYLPIFRQLFQINPACCPSQDRLPQPDESVFHFRNFAHEFHVNHSYDAPTFEEVTPNQTVHSLFSHVSEGDKVVIATRHYSDGGVGGDHPRGFSSTDPDPIVQAHVQALEERGIKVRVLGYDLEDGGNDAAGMARASSHGPTSGIHDFCFLLHAQKELVGNYRSTFSFWAAILGKAHRALLYTIHSPAIKLRFGPFIKSRFEYRWQHEKSLQERVQMVLLPMDKRSRSTE